MPPLIDVGQAPTGFASLRGLLPRKDPDAAFTRLLGVLQQKQSIDARVSQQEADRSQRGRFAIQEQLGDIVSDLQRSASGKELAETNFRNRQELAAGIDQRQIALEEQRQEGRKNLAADKFAKDYGFPDIETMQQAGRQQGHTLETFTRILNGEVLGVPPGNIEKIRLIDGQIEAVRNDPKLQDDPEAQQRLLGELQGQRFKLGSKRLHYPATKPITFQQALDTGMAMELPPGFGLLMQTQKKDGEVKWTHIKPPTTKTEDETAVIHGTELPFLKQEKLVDMLHDEYTKRRKENKELLERDKLSLDPRHVLRAVEKELRATNPAGMRLFEQDQDKKIRVLEAEQAAAAEQRRLAGEAANAATGRVTGFLSAMNKERAPLTRDQLRIGPRAKNDLEQKIGALMAKVQSLEPNDPKRERLLGELEKLVRSADAGN